MKYVEVSIEEAMKRCKKNAKVLVAEQDLENDDCEVIFISKGKKDYGELFKDVQTAVSLSDDLVKQLRLFTEHQDILNIRPQGIQKIVLMREWSPIYWTLNYLDIITCWQTTNKCSIIVLVRNEKTYCFIGVGAPPQ